jgi:FtsP/CotA-like multicopper oxidase with cupredoxin domain
MMRKLLLLVLAACVVASFSALPSPALAAGKTHDMAGTIVSVDTAGKKITFNDDTGTSMTVPVLDKAVGSMKNLKAGQKVTLTCQDNDNGDHEGVSAIKVMDSAKAAKKK